MSTEKYFSLIKTNPRFVDLSQDEVRKILSFCEIESYKKGEDIIKEGQQGDKFYIIAEGEVGVSKLISNQVVFFITTLKAGEIFGEMAVISDYTRSANAFAKTDTTLLYISKDAFNQLKKDYPELFGKLAWIISKVLAERLYKIEERIRNILKATLNQEII